MKKIMLICGHNGKLGEYGDSGAINSEFSKLWSKEDGLGSEFEIVRHVVKNVWEQCTDIPGTRVILNHRGIDTGAYKLLPAEINDINPDIIIEVHLNSVTNKSVDGSEVLYWCNSKKGLQIAQIIQKHLVENLKLKDRGVKALKPDDRGSYLLRNTKAPAVIVEGFFISALTSKTDRDNKIKAYEKSLVDAIHELDKYKIV